MTCPIGSRRDCMIFGATTEAGCSVHPAAQAMMVWNSDTLSLSGTGWSRPCQEPLLLQRWVVHPYPAGVHNTTWTFLYSIICAMDSQEHTPWLRKERDDKDMLYTFEKKILHFVCPLSVCDLMVTRGKVQPDIFQGNQICWDGFLSLLSAVHVK